MASLGPKFGLFLKYPDRGICILFVILKCTSSSQLCIINTLELDTYSFISHKVSTTYLHLHDTKIESKTTL